MRPVIRGNAGFEEPCQDSVLTPRETSPLTRTGARHLGQSEQNMLVYKRKGRADNGRVPRELPEFSPRWASRPTKVMRSTLLTKVAAFSAIRFRAHGQRLASLVGISPKPKPTSPRRPDKLGTSSNALRNCGMSRAEQTGSSADSSAALESIASKESPHQRRPPPSIWFSDRMRGISEHKENSAF